MSTTLLRRRALMTSAFEPLSTIPWHSVFWASDPASGLPADGQAVTTWANSGTSGNNATQATASFQPAFRASVAALNNRQALQFVAGDFMQTTAFTEVADRTIVVIAKVTTTAQSDYLCGGIDAGALKRGDIGQASTGSGWAINAGTQLATGLRDTNLHMFTATFDASSTLEIDNVTLTTGAAGIQGQTGITLGGTHTGTTNGYHGYMAFYGMIDRLLTAEEKTALWNWAKDYYAIVPNTPPTIYVNSVTGTSGGTGAIGSPMQTLAQAVGLLDAQDIGGTILVTAPSGTPLTAGVALSNYAPVRIASADGNPWYCTGGISFRGRAMTTLEDARINVASGAGVTVGADGGIFGLTGQLRAIRCHATTNGTGLSACSFLAADVWTYAEFVDCIGYNSGNDGFGFDADGVITPTAVCINCESYGNDQEGISPHSGVILYVDGGSYHDNGESGCHAINDSEVHISGASFNNNGLLNPSDPDLVGNAGIKLRDNVSGSIDNVTVTNNVGQGLDIDTTVTVTIGSYTSSGNGLPDDVT